jgi:cell division protein FtsN
MMNKTKKENIVLGTKPRGATKRPIVKAKRTDSLVPTWLWTVFGVLVGLTCLVFLYLWQPWQPTSHDSSAQTDTSVNTAQSTDSSKPSKFQFYDLLPKQQVTPIPTQTVPDVIPDEPSSSVVDPASTPFSDSDMSQSTQTKSAQPHYLLQVNSFQSSDDADKQRASVLLAGLPADVRHTISDGQEWYRVVSGPFSSKNEALKAQRQLQDSGIDALVVEQSDN